MLGIGELEAIEARLAKYERGAITRHLQLVKDLHRMVSAYRELQEACAGSLQRAHQEQPYSTLED